ncbi:hypothetical protein [Vibrio nitrifigilis]|uniref:Glycosyltransferase n=1 Tax=Vibrio nitrifigilis TaxID=2789781 RepID=A0ABS0GFM6_9VIBR|nr:hypothetical protein [Vibrio nitrifigilis]MBF9001201.1 hypothetical protein [Vibrio nitrifigilis]
MIFENNKHIEVSRGVIKIKGINALFLRQKNSGQNQFEYINGNKNISRESIDNFIFNIKENNDFCIKNKIIYQHIIFPCKAIAYKQRFESLGIKIKNIVTEEHTSQHNVYYPSLKNISEEWFIINDTHCSYKGYIKIINEALSRAGINIPILPFHLKKSFYKGDVGKMLGEKPIEVDIIDRFDVGSDIHSFTTNHVLPGNNGEMHLKINTQAPIKKRVLLFGDSFFVGCLNYLSHLFSEVLYLREPYIIKDVANCLAPDIILSGNAERYLVNVPNSQTNPPYFTKFLNKNIKMEKLGVINQIAFESFFKPRNSIDYKNWIKDLELVHDIIMNQERDYVSILNDSQIDFIRDYAVNIENADIKYMLMNVAANNRPEGPYIKTKLNDYLLKLNK